MQLSLKTTLHIEIAIMIILFQIKDLMHQINSLFNEIEKLEKKL